MKRYLSWVAWIAAAILLGFLLRRFVVVTTRVAGTSMQDALQPTDIVLVTKFDYWFSGPQRGDVVQCRLPERSASYLKRVVAVPGDTFEIREVVAYLNGQTLTEPYAVGTDQCEDFQVRLEEDEYLVLGDNRLESYDSRAEDVGLLSRSDFIGKARWVIWPFERFHSIA